MRQLGEMMTEEPVAGSFSSLAYKYWGDFPGLFSGWNYWMMYLLVSMTELTAISRFVSYWLPEIEPWQSAAFFFVFISAINLTNVKIFGELEFWLASIKVLAICSMIVFGIIILVGDLAPDTSSIKNLWQYGGFMPTGWKAWALSIPLVMFSYGGLEMLGIAAAETADPQKSIPKAVNQLIYRILIFYIGAVVILLTLYPWDLIVSSQSANWVENMEASPFVLIFHKIGILPAAHILNFVFLTAALSVYNSSIYCNSRILYGLSLQGNAPKALGKTNSRGVPVPALLATSVPTLICVGLNYIDKDILGKLFALVVASIVLNWCMISLTHLKFRKALKKDPKDLLFPAIFYPFSNYLCLVFMLGLFVGLWFLDEQISVMFAPVWILGFYVFYQVVLKNKRKNKKTSSQIV